MSGSNLPFLERYEKQRRRAMDLNFNVAVDRSHIELTPNMFKALEHRNRTPVKLDSVEELERFLDGIEWQVGYCEKLGLDERAAEKAWFEERDRKRIYDTLSKD